jgi:hypothetical protein
MNIETVLKEARRVITEKPHLKDQVIDICQYVRYEIEDGGSEAHECEMGLADIQDLYNNN